VNTSSTADVAERDGPSNATNQTGDPSSGAQPTQKQQGADRPSETPDSNGNMNSSSSKPAMPHTDEEREVLMKTGEFPHDPDDHSGEPMKIHGGGSDRAAAAAAAGDKTARSASVAQEGGAPYGKTLGTGKEYVKSTGMAADGGDFDATNPGAGSEATRKRCKTAFVGLVRFC
jgi:hypothetical protein